MENQHGGAFFLGVKFFQLVSVCGMVMVITLIVRVSIHIKIPEECRCLIEGLGCAWDKSSLFLGETFRILTWRSLLRMSCSNLSRLQVQSSEGPASPPKFHRGMGSPSLVSLTDMEDQRQRIILFVKIRLAKVNRSP